MHTLPHPILKKASLGAMFLLAPLLAQAASYFTWDRVDLPTSSGASCGNGTPYRFFVNRTPFTTKTIVIMEGGGACFDQNACLWKGSFFGGSNSNGIATNYMSSLFSNLPNTSGSPFAPINQGALGLTPFASRTHSSKVQTQSWNIVYMPQCTGDVYAGNKVNVYADADPSKPLTYFHRGDINSRMVAQWMAANMPKPQHLLMYGFSAGALGVSAHYGDFREALKPTKSALLSDSGPLFVAPRSGTAEQYPSLHLHNKIREAWGLDGPDGVVTRLVAKYPGVGDANDMSTLNTGLAKMFPQDRMGYTLLQKDVVFAAYSYDKFFPEIKIESTIEKRNDLRLVKWQKEVRTWVDTMQAYPNIGYYIPYSRPQVFHSHSTTMFSFNNTEIPELGHKSVTAFVDNLLDGTAPTMRAYEQAQTTKKPVSDSISEFFGNLIFVPLGL
jgi:Pectinacetylesterase